MEFRVSLVVFLALSIGFAKERTVVQMGGGDFTTVQAGIDASKPFDTLTIMDTATYAEQVTLSANLHHFTLRSAHPEWPKKPTIRWLDNTNTGPHSCPEALVESKITFYKNGALRLMGVRYVRIQGIAVDGGGATPFAYTNVWGSGINCNGVLYPLFHGNSGVLLWNSAHVQITKCDISGSYFGIYERDDLDVGPYAINPENVNSNRIRPITALSSGNHLISGNYIHHNSWAAFLENSYGLGSTFRDNDLYQNHHTNDLLKIVKTMTSEGQNQPGGAFLFKNTRFCPHVIHNNTLSQNFLIFAGAWRPGAHYLIANNLITTPNLYWNDPINLFQNSFQELFPVFTNRATHTILAAQSELPKLDSQIIQVQEMDPGTQQQVSADTTISFYRSIRIMNRLAEPQLGNLNVTLTVPLSTGPKAITKSVAGVTLPGALLKGGSNPYPPDAENRWLETEFISTNPLDSDFLQPIPAQKNFFQGKGWPDLGYNSTSGEAAPIGALPFSQQAPLNLHVIPLAPVMLEDGKLSLYFNAKAWDGPLADLRVRYMRLVASLPNNSDAFGGGLPTLPAAEILATPTAALKIGFNSIQVNSTLKSLDSIGFVEMAVQARNASGQWVFSNMATFPIVPLIAPFKVEVLQAQTDSAVEFIEAGDIVRIRVSQKNPTDTLSIHALFLASGNPIQILDSITRDTNGLVALKPPFTLRARILDLPDGGADMVGVSALPGITAKASPYSLSKPFGTKAWTTASHAYRQTKRGVRKNLKAPTLKTKALPDALGRGQGKARSP